MDITKLNKLAILFFIIGRFYVNLLLAEEIDYEDFTTTLKNLEEITVKTPNQRFKFNKDRIPSPISKRIIGGAVAGKHEYPFQAVLYIYVGTNLFFCGGTLITTQWVLTAAHCCDGASSIIVVLGAHNINLKESTTKAFNTSLYRIHENWDSERITYDIALIHLGGTPVILNEYIQTVEIASSDDYDDDDGGYNNNNSYTDQTGRCLGWGKTVFGSLSSVLRYVDSSIISNDACSTYPDYRYYIRSQHLCTSGENKVGSCNGDSGGPLIVDGLQVGIVSFGAEDCSTGYPSVFTRITEFSSWVKNTTRTFELITYEDEIISLGLGIRRYSSIFNLLTLIIFNTVKNLLLN